MTQQNERSNKGAVYASIIGLVLLANVALSTVGIFANHPTEAHKVVARQLDIFSLDNINGTDFSVAMNTPEYIAAEKSPEAQYTNTVSIVTFIINILGGTAIIGAVYYYLRRHHLTNKAVGVTVLLVSVGQLIPSIAAPYAATKYLGTEMPGIGTFVFMSAVGVIIMPFIVLVVAKLFEWQYNRKHSFEI